MMNQLNSIAIFVFEAFLHVWPYLLVTIPLAVAARMSGASKYIRKAFQASPVIAILLATAVGAFSPFCSCTVIPIINGLLISGVPLAPVMSFWIASPSMDPEIFFLSVASVGWELALWRLMSALILSLGAGFLTYYLEKKEFLGREVLRTSRISSSMSLWSRARGGLRALRKRLAISPGLGFVPVSPSPVVVCCGEGADTNAHFVSEVYRTKLLPVKGQECRTGGIDEDGNACSQDSVPFLYRLSKEVWEATIMVVKFMILAFLLEALIELFIPAEWLSVLIGGDNPWSILAAAFLGIPAYTSSLAALPMVGGLLSKGMSPAAGLTFLIAGPTTTLPAMTAVWGIVSRRVFGLYIVISLLGAIAIGYLYKLLG